MRANKMLYRQHVRPGDSTAQPAQWSQRVTQGSNALDLEPGVFTWHDPRAIAQSLKDSAEMSQRKKATSFQSAMSMLTFYLNRAGSQLAPEQRACLEAAKDELRELYGRARHDAPGFETTPKNKRGAPSSPAHALTA